MHNTLIIMSGTALFVGGWAMILTGNVIAGAVLLSIGMLMLGLLGGMGLLWWHFKTEGCIDEQFIRKYRAKGGKK
ncbi:hypothetical protein FP74_gp116 [Bacillus phage CAM003]|uniref:Uncharacterized protein n=2 Tax=Bastillevirus TaxID=1918010 RepID=A0A024B2Y1_9CAUD|nr:hypothetical protein FP73_gp107 [Bacillus phage Hoody T]YP_009037146.1 hypothetical protein FP74_gp116 [Bacillus phage CAM003]AHZ09680.1 hypothetical protein [Bacillus phage CAM003]AHZ10546.1 hypothetical protein [Bacillus phage Hoody T]